jgi:hypothetical protein
LQPRLRGILFSLILRVSLLGGIFLLLPVDLQADQNRDHVVCRENFSQNDRDKLTNKLRKITGLPDLGFDGGGVLRLGIQEPVGGSEHARKLLTKVISGPTIVILEDASKSDVVFSRVIPGIWKLGGPDTPPIFVMQIDFADFEYVMGDVRALEAFDIGWAVLHEFDHLVNDARDATRLDEAGECEDHINQMRRECGLPQRADYFFTFSPLSNDTAFRTRLVRLAFDQEKAPTGKKKRYWLVWDAKLVGGLDEKKQIAVLR